MSWCHCNLFEWLYHWLAQCLYECYFIDFFTIDAWLGTAKKALNSHQTQFHCERVWSGWVWSGRETIDVHINTGCLNNLQVMEVFPLYRCIRPNELKSPDQFQTDKVLVQLRYTGVLETTRIRKEVWSVRREGERCVEWDFVYSRKCLSPSARVSLTESSLKTLFRG